MGGTCDLYSALMRLASGEDTLNLLVDARSHGLILSAPEWADTAIFTDDALEALNRIAKHYAAIVNEIAAFFLPCALPGAYFTAVCREIVSLLALGRASARLAGGSVSAADIYKAAERLRSFAVQRRSGEADICKYYLLLSMHWELGAMMQKSVTRAGYLMGILQYPWSDPGLTGQLYVYKTAGVIREKCTESAVVLSVTRKGKAVWEQAGATLHQANYPGIAG